MSGSYRPRTGGKIYFVIFNSVCVCVSVCLPVGVKAAACEGQRC